MENNIKARTRYKFLNTECNSKRRYKKTKTQCGSAVFSIYVVEPTANKLRENSKP